MSGAMRVNKAAWRAKQLEDRANTYQRLEVEARERSARRCQLVLDTVECTSVLCGLAVLDAFFRPMACNAIFRCGCSWGWAGGGSTCNVHDSIPPAQRCPWCMATGLAAQLISLHLYAFVGYSVARLHEARPWVRLVLVPAAVWLLAALLLGAIFKFAEQPDYPYFLGLRLGGPSASAAAAVSTTTSSSMTTSHAHATGTAAPVGVG